MNANADPAAAAGGNVQPPGPGALLRLARERAGLAVDDLANQIKLARGTLEALEADNFAALSEPVYVRGYYRKIAKALGTPEKELLDAYAARHPAPVAALRPQALPLAGGVDAGASRRAQGQGLLVVGAVVVMSIALLVLLAEPPRSVRLAKPVDAEIPAAAPVDPAASTVVAPAGEPPSLEAVAAVATPVATPVAAPARAESAAPAPTPAAPPVATGPRATAVAAPATSTQITLQFNESSFARIEDSRGRTLLVGLVKGGERPVLDGQPPYTVFLGNAQNVKVLRNGQEVNFSADINAQNSTARFSVP